MSHYKSKYFERKKRREASEFKDIGVAISADMEVKVAKGDVIGGLYASGVVAFFSWLGA